MIPVNTAYAPIRVVTIDANGDPIPVASGSSDVTASASLIDAKHTPITSTTSETTIIPAGGTGVFNHIYGLILSNKSATATTVTIKDDTAGTTRLVFSVPAGQTTGFMVTPYGAHRQAVANKPWTATSSASIDSLYVTALFTKSTT